MIQGRRGFENGGLIIDFSFSGEGVGDFNS